MGYEIDMEEAGRRLEAGLTQAFSEFFAQFPSGIVREIDSRTDDSMTVYIGAEDGTGETWLISFAVGQPFEFTRIG